MRSPGLIDPLRRRAFRRLAASYAINEFGDWMGIVALSVLVFEQTGSALALTGVFLGSRLVPALLAPFFVTRGEKQPPRFALPVIYCGEAAAFAGLALLADHFSLAAVIVLAATDGVLALTGRSLTRAVVAALLEPAGELRAGNAVLNVAFTGSAALGPGLAGIAVAGSDAQTALLIDAVSFFAVAVILFTAGHLPQAEPEPGLMRERVRAGVAYLRLNRTVRRLLTAQGMAFVFFAAVIPIEVIYAKESLGAGDSGYGLLLTSWGVGMVLGSLVFAGVRRAPLPLLLLFSTLAVGGGYLGMAAAPTLGLACAASVLGGAGNGIQWVSVVSAIQELTASEMQARVMSVLESVGAAMPGVGIVAGGVITTVLDPRAAFLFAGAGIVLIVVVFAPLLGSHWAKAPVIRDSHPLDPGNEVVLELVPGAFPGVPQSQSDPEAES